MKRTKNFFTLFMAVAMLGIFMLVLPISANNGSDTSNSRNSVAGVAGNNWHSSRNNQFRTGVPSGRPQGRNTSILMDTTSTLQGNFASNNSRRLTLELWEADGWFSADDHVRTITYSFTGRTLNNTAVSNALHTSGDLEAGRNIELYTRWRISTHTGDPTTPNISSGFFTYRIRLTW